MKGGVGVNTSFFLVFFGLLMFCVMMYSLLMLKKLSWQGWIRDTNVRLDKKILGLKMILNSPRATSEEIIASIKETSDIMCNFFMYYIPTNFSNYLWESTKLDFTSPVVRERFLNDLEMQYRAYQVDAKTVQNWSIGMLLKKHAIYF